MGQFKPMINLEEEIGLIFVRVGMTFNQLYGAFGSVYKPRIEGIEKQGNNLTRVHISHKGRLGLIVKDPNAVFRFASPNKSKKFKPKDDYTDRINPTLLTPRDFDNTCEDFIREMIRSENYRGKKMEPVRSINKTKKQEQDTGHMNLEGLRTTPQHSSGPSANRSNEQQNKRNRRRRLSLS